MAGLVRASGIQPAFLSPHRKRRWRPNESRIGKLIPQATACSSLRTCIADRERDLNTSCLRNSRYFGWRPRMRCFTILKAGSSVAMSAISGNWLIDVALATQSDNSTIQSASLELVPVESVSTSAPLPGDHLPTLGHSLVNLLLDAFASFHADSSIATIILAGIVVAYLARNYGGNRDTLLDEGVEKSVEIVSRPSPFNRFVTRRCPSILSPSAPLAFGKRKEQIRELESRAVYRRQCLHAPDGGVVAIDWPARLEFTGEDGFDNTLLLIPGTTEGSGDEGIEKFVVDAMRYGYFPIVLNPRGCGGSPLTTPRVFTAADSDDVRLAVQHIIRAQPGCTLMGVGWGLGANMLAKYLGEEAGSTPLMAAACISNPFDLEETSQHLSRTRGGKHDRALAEGFVNILKANKMLFVGDKKRYDLSRALASTSVREFETAISKVNYGFETLEDFYTAASSASHISTVQVPLLFIQGEDDAIPVASVPRQTLEANPFTTALVAHFSTSAPPPNNDASAKQPGSASRHDWSHTVAFEVVNRVLSPCLHWNTPTYIYPSGKRTKSAKLKWLAAVEVALLKGKHPLLDIVNLHAESDDVNISSSQSTMRDGQAIEKKDMVSSSRSARASGATLVQSSDDEGQEYGQDVATSAPRDRHEKRGLVFGEAENGSVAKSKEAERKEKDEAEGLVAPVSEKNSEEPDAHAEETNPPQEAVPEGEAEGEPEEGSEAFQMRAAAESIMKVLDITMPGTLSDEKKTQVLTAVGKGQTIVTAFQEAVPEEVRGSMAAAVSGAVQARGLSFNLVGFGKNMPPPSLPADLINSIKGKLAAVSSGEKEAPHGPSVSPLPDSPPPSSSGEHKKQDQEAHEPGNVGNDHNEDHSKESGNNEKPKAEESTSEAQGASDYQNKKATPGGGGDGDGEGHAHPETHDEDAKAKASEGTKDGGNESSRSDAGKDDNAAKQAEDKASSEKKVNSEEWKQGENTASSDHKEEATKDSKGAENKDGVVEAPTDQAPQKEDRKPDNSAADSSQNAKEAATKPEGGDGQPPPPGTPDLVNAAAAAAPAPAAPAPPPPASPSPPSAVKTGMAPPIDMRLAFQALTGFDDSTQMAVTNVFGVVESMLEQLEKDQKATELDAPDAAKDAGDDQEKESEAEEGEKADQGQEQKQTTDSRDDGDDGATKTAENGDADRDTDTDDSDDDDNHDRDADETSNGAEGTPVEAAHSGSQGEDKKKDTTSKGQKNSETGRNRLVPLHGHPAALSSKSSNQSAVQRPLSNVMVTQKVGSSTLVKTILKDDERPQVTNGVYRGLNGAASLTGDSVKTQQEGVLPRQVSSEGAGPHIQQSNQLGREAVVMKPSILKASEMTIEQLSLEVNQEQRKEEDNRAAGSGLQGSQTIEVEVTDIKDLKSPNTVQSMVADALKLELLRRLGVAGMESLGVDLEKEVAKVADTVAEAVQRWKQKPASNEAGSGKLEILQSDSIVNALGTVVSGTHVLGGLVPIGVLAGVVLASLGAVYLIVTDNRKEAEEEEAKAEEEDEKHGPTEPSSWHDSKALALDVPVLSLNRHDEVDSDNQMEGSSEDEIQELQASHNDGHNEEAAGPSEEREEREEGAGQNKLMGMMAAAVTGGATLAGMGMANQGTATKDQDGSKDVGERPMEEKPGTKRENPSIISSFQPLAEKAMSVAAPVVPTTEDGEIDHERLVAMLAELGQKGGFFRLIGKVALLWGGLRGAMSLTDRLLVFLRVKERPLHLRLVGFAAMIVLLWSPVLVPVLPSLLHQWATKAPSGVADAASVVGLYGAILILVTIWGKRVRGYSKPLLHYGLRLYSRRKVQDILNGMALGCGLVAALYSTNSVLGYVQFNWRELLATNVKIPGVAAVTIFTALKVCKLLGQAVGIGLAVALVEEVLFRAWLQEEIAIDLGFHKAVFLSALAFSLVHWSPAAMPGLWFLSVALAGARAKTGRNLAFPIGLHSGLVAANYVVTVGGLAHFLPHAPAWFTGAHIGNPLAGALGTAMTAMLAVILYPRTIAPPLAMTLPSDSTQSVENRP